MPKLCRHPPLFVTTFYTMPVCPAPHEITHHSTYWLPGGDLHVIINNIAFHIYHYFFKQNSSIFKSWLKEGDNTTFHPSGTSTATAFIPDDVSPEAFTDLLWVFYNPTYLLCNTKTCNQWFGILHIAEHYTFNGVRELCYRELSCLVDQADSDTDRETNSGPDQSVHTTSRSTIYHSDSDNALPRPAQAASVASQPPSSEAVITTPIHIPHPNHPYGVNQDGLLHITAHSTN